MKIIHIITAFGIGGAEILLLNVLNRQVKDHDVHLIYLKPIDSLISELNKQVIVKHIPFSILIVQELKKYYRQHQPDIIHTHLVHADLVGLYSARNIKTKLFCTIHNIYIKQNFVDVLIFGIYRFILLKKVNVISISKSVENHVIRRLKVSKERSFLLYNAIPKTLMVVKKKEEKELILLFVGRLVKQKSVETLLKAIRIIKEKKLKIKIKLLIIGDGPLKEKLLNLIIDLGLENMVQFIGEEKNIQKYYVKADIFVLPSIWEGFGIVILEAFRAKLAVIASNIEGPAELIENEVNGLLFEPKNHVQLSEKMAQLINNNELRARIANNGYLSFSKKYDIDNYVEKLNELYESV